jgi:hypothetical protein
LLWLGTDPSQQLLVTGSEEPIAAREGKTASPVAVGAKTAGQKVQSEQTGLMLRILRRDSGQVMLVSHPRTAVHLSINSDGYLESLRTKGIEWLVNLRSFHGGNTPVGRLDSSCAPSYIFVSERELVATICDSHGGHRLVAMGIDGQRLWEALLSENEIWPRLTPSPDGSRLARETLTVSREVNASSPLTTEDVKGQLVEIYDAANGKIALTAPITPALDGGGNVALSPTGRRVAVLNAGFIQIFELPAPLLLPDISGNHSPH